MELKHLPYCINHRVEWNKSTNFITSINVRY